MYASSSSQGARRAFDKSAHGTGVTSSATYGAERLPLYNDQGGGTVHISSCSASGSTSRQRTPQSTTALSYTFRCNAREPLKCRTSSGSIKTRTSREPTGDLGGVRGLTVLPGGSSGMHRMRPHTYLETILLLNVCFLYCEETCLHRLRRFQRRILD